MPDRCEPICTELRVDNPDGPRLRHDRKYRAICAICGAKYTISTCRSGLATDPIDADARYQWGPALDPTVHMALGGDD